MSIVYIYNPSRAHKLLPLLEGLDIVCFRGLSSVMELIRFPKTDAVVVVDSFGKYAIKGMLVSALFRLPLVVRLRGDFIRELKEVHKMCPSIASTVLMWIHRMLGELCIRSARLIITNSYYLKKVMKEHYPRINIEVVFNPYTPPSASGRDEDIMLTIPTYGFHLLSITNFNLESKVTPLLKAITEWMPYDYWEKYDMYWIVCGSGELSDEFYNQINMHSFSKRVLYLGHSKNIESLMKWSNVFVHMSCLDAFPNVTMEAMMFEKPVIVNADSCGTLEQVYDHKNGFVVSNSDAFSKAISFLESNPEKAQAFGKAGRENVINNFSVLRQSILMRNALEKALGANKYE